MRTNAERGVHDNEASDAFGEGQWQSESQHASPILTITTYYKIPISRERKGRGCEGGGRYVDDQGDVLEVEPLDELDQSAAMHFK